MKVEVTSPLLTTDVFWIDVEHGFLMRREEKYIVREGETLLTDRIDVPQLQEVGGIWAPTLAEQSSFIWGEKINPLPQKMESKKADSEKYAMVVGKHVALPLGTKRVLIEDFDAQCQECDFKSEMNWPLKTKVNDLARRKTFIVVAAEKEEMERYQAKRKLYDEVESRALTSQELATLNESREERGQSQLLEALAVTLTVEEWADLKRERK